MARSSVDVKYDEELVKYIQDLFTHKIVPENFILVVHKYDLNVLTVADIQRLRKAVDLKATVEVNYDLLITMKNYKGWFEVILNVCKDRDIKQEYLVEEFMALKRKLDETWPSGQAQIEHLSSQLGNLSLTLNDEHDEDGAPPKTRKSDIGNRKEPTTECQGGAEGWEMKDGSGYCYVCSVKLTSEKLKDQHINGKAHQKKAKERSQSTSFNETQERSQNTSSNETQERSQNTSFTETQERSENTSFNERQAETAVVASADNYILNDDGTGECKICEIKFTSTNHARQHLEGIKHKKKIEALQPKIETKAPPTLGPNGEIYSTNEHGKGTCYVCGVSLTSKEDTEQHLAGKKHKNKCAESGLQ